MRIGLGVMVGFLLIASGTACSRLEGDSTEGSDAQAGRPGPSDSEQLSKLRSKKERLEDELSDLGPVWKKKAAELRTAQEDAIAKNAGVEPGNATDFTSQLALKKSEVDQVANKMKSLKKQIQEIDDQITTLLAKVKVAKSESVIKHRAAKAQKVAQLEKQLVGLQDSYEGQFRCSGLADLSKGWRTSVWLGTTPQEKQAVETKIMERRVKCATVGNDVDNKEAELRGARRELAEAEKLVSEMLQRAYGTSGSNILADGNTKGFQAGCYKISSGQSPVYTNKEKSGQKSPPSGTYGVKYVVGQGSMFYLHTVWGSLLNVTIKSGTFDNVGGWIDTGSASVSKVDGKYCAN